MKKILILILLTLFISACSKEKKEEANIESLPDSLKVSAEREAAGVKFKVQYEKPRSIYKMDSYDLDNDGKDEMIVLSVVKNEPNPKHFDYYNFDLIQVFKINGSGDNYERIMSDTVDYAVSAEYLDLGNTGKTQVVIKTNTGGNNPVISKGMFIYNINGRTVELVKYFDAGNPEITDINNDGKKEIIITESYWGVMTNVDVINYISDVFVMENNALVRKNTDYKDYFEKSVSELKDKYENMKASFIEGKKPKPSEYPLYKEAVNIAVNYYAKQDPQSLKAFWDNENAFLQKNLPEDQFIDLQNFILRIIPLIQSA